MGMCKNIYRVLGKITVEPALLFYFVTYILIDVVNTNLYLQKACRVNTTSEPNLDIPCDNEKQGVLFVSSFNANYRFIQYILMLVVITLTMSWSDEAGMKRKILVILPIIGVVVQSLNGCLQSYFWYWSPSTAALIDSAAQAFSGGFVLMICGSQVHVCDKSRVADRTMRVGILTALKNISFPIGNGMAGDLIRTVGFFKSFLICLALSTTSLVSAVLLVHDEEVPAQKVSFWSLFKLTSVIDSFRVTFKKSLGRKRIIVLLLLVVHVVVLFGQEGEKSVFYLFMRHKFKWDERLFGRYQTFRLAGIIVGTIFCSIILSKVCKLHDGVIGTFAGFWDIWAALGYVFASQLWHLYLIPLLDIFHGTAVAINFSFLTRFYDSNEFGRLNAVYNAFSFFNSFCYPAYNTVFQKTLDIFPSAIFLLSVAINVVVCLLYAASYVMTKRIESEEQNEKVLSMKKRGYENQATEIIDIDMITHSSSFQNQTKDTKNNDVIEN